MRVFLENCKIVDVIAFFVLVLVVISDFVNHEDWHAAVIMTIVAFYFGNAKEKHDTEKTKQAETKIEVKKFF